MKKLWLAAVVLVLGLSSNGYSQVNYGFETGDTNGWVETFPQDFGNIDVVTNWTSDRTLGASGRWPVTYEPVEGNYFVALETGAPTGDFTVLSQTISLNQGNTLEGWATFCCGSEVYYPYFPIDADNYNDYALISVLNNQGQVVAEPWYADSFDLGYEITTPEGERTGELVDFGPLPWEHWSWTAPTSDSYTLQYKITQVGDVIGNSYAFFDGPHDKSTAVPEPSSMILLGLAGAGVFAAHRFSLFNI